MDHKYCVLDFETYSECELSECGAHVYAEHSTTRVLCASWMFGTLETLEDAVIRNIPPLVSRNIEEIVEAIEMSAEMDPELIFVAHNAQFERAILRSVLKCSENVLNPRRWRCTMSMSMAVGLPRSLEQVSNVLNLPVTKDMEGAGLMKKITVPASITKNNTDKMRLHTEDNLIRLAEYCMMDVVAEVWLFLTLPQLNDTEQQVWEMDQEINDRGMCIDSQLVENAYLLLMDEVERAEVRVKELTHGEVSSAREVKKFSDYLKRFNIEIPNLTKETVEAHVDQRTFEHIPEVQELLELRLIASKSSTAKFESFLNHRCSDSRVRGSLVYHAASTGRWGGAGVQPQNLPRPHLSQHAIDVMTNIVKNEPDGAGDWVRALDRNTLACFSSLLRSAIVAESGYILDVADFNAIELRVAYWLAGFDKGLDDFRNNRPMYEEMAQKIYKLDNIKDVSGTQRTTGKVVNLGCIYGMGGNKLLGQFKKYRLDVDEEFANLCVQIFRQEHMPIQQMWRNYERAALAAINSPGQRFDINRVSWIYENNFLLCELPSGRFIRYPYAEIKMMVPGFGGDPKPTICYWGVNSQTRKWTQKQTYGGKLTENISQAVAREVMAHAMLRVRETGYWKLVLSIHDELISERAEGGPGDLKSYESILGESPGWAPDLPLVAKGYSSYRYKKG